KIPLPTSASVRSSSRPLRLPIDIAPSRMLKQPASGVLSRPSPCNVSPLLTELSWQLGVGRWEWQTLQSPSSLRPCWDAILSILRGVPPVVLHVRCALCWVRYVWDQISTNSARTSVAVTPTWCEWGDVCPNRHRPYVCFP